MNKTIKVLSLALLLSTAVFAAEEVVTEEVVTEVTKKAEDSTPTTVDKVKSAVQKAVDAAGEKLEVTEEAITRFFDNVDETVSDKAAYIKNNISSFIASLSKKSEKTETAEETKTA